jgi:dolichol-phosphate mannosyltransferase
MESQAQPKPSVAVAIPSYNEAEGLPGFVQEIDRALSQHVRELRFIVVDDASSDGTVKALEAIRPELEGELELMTNQANQGHGPSVLTGYHHALAGSPDYVMQVDGDGQFHGSDLRRLLVLLVDEAHAVSGVRRFRQDPWFRMTMTRLLRSYVRWRFGVAARDPNCPLRGYEAALLRELLEVVPDGCLVPNLYLTIVAARRGVALLEVDVSHRVRRGSAAEGSSWGRRGFSPIPWRLVRFSLAALHESDEFRKRMDLPGWARQARP